MIQYHYQPVGETLFQDVTRALTIGQSVVLLAARHSGKRYTARLVAERLRADRAGTVALAELHPEIRTSDHLAARIALAADREPGANLFDVVDRHWHERQAPLILLVPNLDILPHVLVQRFLQGVRVRVEARSLVVLLGGDQQFRDYVHGPNSEFNCTRQYVLQGFDEPEFFAIIERYKPQFTFGIGPETRARLWRNTGGQPLLMKSLLARAVELRAKGAIEDHAPLTVEEADGLPDPRYSSAASLRQMFAAADENLRRSPEVWPVLEYLRNHPNDSWPAPLEPGPLELSGIARRDEKHQLRLSSPFARRFAELQYSPRRLADLYGILGKWSEAFKRYEGLREEDWLRPQTAADRTEVELVLRSLSTYLHSEEDPAKVLDSFVRGGRYLLGFREASLWRKRSTWQLDREHGSSFPSSREYAFSQALPSECSNQSRLLDLPEPWSRISLVATLRMPGGDDPAIVCLGDMSEERSIPKDRLTLATDYFKSFLAAYDHAGQIQYLQRQKDTMGRCVQILDSILDVVGRLDLDRNSICKTVAQELRKLDYRRVLLCLVDRERRRIEGIWDESDQKPHVDVARMTQYDLTEIQRDLQPFVIWSKKPFATADASKEPLANPRVYEVTQQLGIAIVPILDREGEAVGTIHVERSDRQKPSEREIEDLMSFGRRLALILEHAERATLLNKSLDLSMDPIAILDPSLRWRYANAAAAELLGIPQGWRSWTTAAAIRTDSPLYPHGRRCLTDGERGADQLSADEIIGLRNQGDRFHLSAAPVRDAAREISGVCFSVREFSRVQLLLRVIHEVIRAGTAEAALDALLRGMETLGHPSSRIYLTKVVDGKERLVSYRACGLLEEDLRRFNESSFLLAERDGLHHSWACIEKQRGLIFTWIPEGIEGAEARTEIGLTAIVVTDPEYQVQLGKKPYDFWIDLPLFSAGGRALGKLATHIDKDLDPQQFWILQLLASIVSAVVDVFLEHDRQHRESLEQEYQRSLATISHHLMNRVIALDALHWRFRRSETHPSELPAVNRDFQAILGTITATITRARDFLKLPEPQPTLFNLSDLCSALTSSHLPANVSTSYHCPAGPVMVFADHDLVSIAFAEILANAGKALRSTSCARFDLSIETCRDVVRVRFADNGPGVRPEIRDRLFDDFFSSWPSSSPRGTGLGLGWTRRVMRAHKGDIVLDEGHSPGACFVVTFPVFSTEDLA